MKLNMAKKIKITFEQIKINESELKSQIDSIFDILFEETLKSLSEKEKKNIPLNQTKIVKEVSMYA